MAVPLFVPEPFESEPAFTIATPTATVFDNGGFSCSAKCAILIDAESGSVLYSKNADDKRGMASTTKIMTALVVIENADISETVVIPPEAVGVEGSSVYLTEGELLTVRELLYCMLLESGNDAAEALAIHCAGSEKAFSDLMNERISELCISDTAFSNPHGLSDSRHYTTARSLALITAEAMKYPLFREIVSTKSMRVSGFGYKNGRNLCNHNKLLWSYDGALGVKTGYTAADGRCLVSCAERDGLTLIAVTLDDPSPSMTHRALLDYGFANYESVCIARSGDIVVPVDVVGGKNNSILASNPNDVYVCLPKGAKYRIDLSVPHFVYAPVKKCDVIAYAMCVCGKKTVDIIYLESNESVEYKRISFFERIFG